MKLSKSSLFGFTLALATLFLCSGRAQARAEDGRLLIRFSPTLGMNVGLRVGIDGDGAGVFVRGHTYERYLSPGRHRITLRRNGRRLDELNQIVRVQPGMTYSYVAKLPGSTLVLEPSGVPQ